jgi:hypothetical protein
MNAITSQPRYSGFAAYRLVIAGSSGLGRGPSQRLLELLIEAPVQGRLALARLLRCGSRLALLGGSLPPLRPDCYDSGGDRRLNDRRLHRGVSGGDRRLNDRRLHRGVSGGDRRLNDWRLHMGVSGGDRRCLHQRTR